MEPTIDNGAPQPKKDRISDRLRKGAAWIVAARIFMVGALMAHTVILARLLTPEAFGLAAIATTIAAIVEMATKQSLTSALVQLPKVTREHIDTAFTLNLVRGVLMGAVIFMLAWPMALVYDNEQVTPMLLALGVSTSMLGISNPNLYILTRNLEFWQEFARVVFERTAMLAAAIPIAYFYHSHWAIIAGVAAGQLSLIVSSFIFVPYRPSLTFARTRELLSFSIWVSLSQLLQATVSRMDDLLVGYFLGTGPLGVLTVAGRLADMPTKETSMPLLRTAFPGFAKVGSNKDKLRPAYQRVQGMIFLLSFPAAVGLALVAEPVVLLFLGEKWRDGIIVVQLLAGAAGLNAMASTVGPLAMSQGETRRLFIRTLTNTGLRLPMVLTGLLSYGLIGLLVAKIVHAFTSITVNMNLVRGMIGLTIFEQISANGRTIISTLAMAGVLLVTNQYLSLDGDIISLAIELAAKIAIGGATFLTVLFGLWSLAKRPEGCESEMIRMLPGIGGRFQKRP